MNRHFNMLAYFTPSVKKQPPKFFFAPGGQKPPLQRGGFCTGLKTRFFKSPLCLEKQALPAVRLPSLRCSGPTRHRLGSERTSAAPQNARVTLVFFSQTVFRLLPLVFYHYVISAFRAAGSLTSLKPCLVTGPSHMSLLANRTAGRNFRFLAGAI
jgi:hypothetical protein